MSSRSRLIRDSVLGLAVMIVGVVVIAVVTAPLPVDTLLGLQCVYIAFAGIQRYRRTRTQR